MESSEMQALCKPYGPPGLKCEVVPVPAPPGPGDVMIKVLAASVCGTDLHIYGSDPSIRDRVAHNQIIGHEFCGEVVATGPQVTRVALGDLVSSESHIVCGTCEYCLDGLSHLCQEVSLIGVDRPGGLAQYAVIPEQNAIKKPRDVSIEVAATFDAYGNAVDTALCTPLVGKRVLISGCGPQGLMAIGIAIASGARQVIGTETQATRRQMADDILEQHLRDPELKKRRKDVILDARDPNLIDAIFQATHGRGVDVLLEMSGHRDAIRIGISALRNAGHAVLLGISSENLVEVDWSSLMFKGITLHFRYGRHLYRTWSDGRHLLESGLVKLEPLIYPDYFELKDYATAFQYLKEGRAAKVIFRPNGDFSKYQTHAA